MKKIICLLLGISVICLTSHCQENPWKGSSADLNHGKLKISENKRFLVFEDNTPFFYLGDTGWELFHRLNKEDTEKYLENRRSKGFTVIQAVALAELDGLNTPNAEGHRPLIDNDPLKPNEAYFQHVDWVIRKAAEKGIFIGLLPTWGDKVDKRWGTGPVIFNKEDAFRYGQWIGNRYKDFPNIIWINGGDRDGGGDNKPIWEALANGIKSADKDHLMTFHPWGERSSSEWFHDSAWLDFNMSQTGHGHARRLIESRPFLSRIPDQSMIAPGYFPETDFIVATRGDGYAFVYFPTGWSADIILEKIGGTEINAFWFDPRTGESKPAGKFPGKSTQKFTPPSNGRGNDWVLVLDDASKSFKKPGQ